MKACPYCAEEIQDAAIVCKHCGRDVPQSVPLPASPVPALGPTNEAISSFPGARIIGAVAIVAVAIAGAVFWYRAQFPDTNATTAPTKSLDAKVSATTVALTIENPTDDDFASVDVTIRTAPGARAFRSSVDRITAHQTARLLLNDFATANGERWNPFALKIDHVTIDASTNGERASGMYKFK